MQQKVKGEKEAKTLNYSFNLLYMYNKMIKSTVGSINQVKQTCHFICFLVGV